MLEGTKPDEVGGVQNVGEVLGVAAAAEIEDEDNGGCMSRRNIWK